MHVYPISSIMIGETVIRVTTKTSKLFNFAVNMRGSRCIIPDYNGSYTIIYSNI